jgi:hypothetical protein
LFDKFTQAGRRWQSEYLMVNARELNHANSLAHALYFAGALAAHLWRDAPAMGEYTDELVAFANEHRFSLWLNWGRVRKAG